jgi:DNA modification methylase
MNVLNQKIGERYALYNGDCVEVLKGIPDNSIHYSITSIPFASLYTYSNSERDMGNCRSYGEFEEQYQFLGREWYRVLMPGRLVSIHCMNLPAMKERDGYIGMKDFRGDVIRWMESIGFIYHAEVCIWKDPVVEMQRTKALGLLHKQIKKDSAMSRMGIPDYLVTFRKPGENPERIEHTNETYPVGHWQQVASPAWKEYASPVWWDINQSDTLNRNGAREEQDEKHICPLQLPVIERGIELWTNQDDIVLDPFDGIGSTGYQAVKMGRRHIGVELKGSYYAMASENLEQAEEEYKASLDPAQTRMF